MSREALHKEMTRLRQAERVARIYKAVLQELHDEVLPNWSKREAINYIEETLNEHQLQAKSDG